MPDDRTPDDPSPAERRPRDRRNDRREDDREPGRGDRGQEQLQRWAAQLEKFAETVVSARRQGRDATAEAGEHAERADGARRRAETASPRDDAVAEHTERARQAAGEARRHRNAGASALERLEARVGEFRTATKAFEAAVERRDPKAAQRALDTADIVTDAVTDALDPVVSARDAAGDASERSVAAASAAHDAAERAAERAEQQGAEEAQAAREAEKRLAQWAERFELHEAIARKHLDAATADAEAAVDAARHATADAERAAAARPSNVEVERAATQAAEAARQAAAARRRARAVLDELRKHLETLAAARKEFDDAVERRDIERALAALDDAERCADLADDTRGPVADQRAQAEHAAADARRAAERAEAAARDAQLDDDRIDEHRDAVQRARRIADDVAGRLAEVAATVDDATAPADDVDRLLAKGERCAERAARSPVHGSTARAALADAAEHAERAAGTRTEIDRLVERLRRLAERIGELADRAAAVHAEKPTDDTVVELLEGVEELGRELRQLLERLDELLDEHRAHLDAVEAAVEAACDAARRARLDGRPTGGGGGVLRPPLPQPVPTPDIDPDTDPDSDPDSEDELVGEVPLLLVPVRIETRFGTPGEKTTPLRIRIYPDRISVCDQLTTPTEAEVEIARQYWTSHLEAENTENTDDGDDERGREEVGAAQAAAWSWLVDRLDIHRAGHLARLTRPQQRRGRLEWPDVETTDVEMPAVAKHLPKRFVAIGFSNGAEVFRAKGQELDGEPYHTSPDPLADTERTDLGITTTEHMRWVVDYDNALARGMAITVDVEQAWGTIDTLIVVGIDRSGDAADALGDLLATHTTSQGFAFVPQGTPTNNTDTVEAGWTRHQRERDVIADRRRADLDDELDVNAASNVARFARALGLSDTTQLARQPFALDREWSRGAAMRAGLYDVVIGRYLDELIPTGHRRVLSDTAHEDFRTWFVDHVTGAAAIPSFRVGPQPYAVLPVLRRGNTDNRPTIGHHVAPVVERLKEEWLRTLNDGIARLDHEVGDDPEAVRGNIAEVLASEPHPTDLSVRQLSLHEHTSGRLDEMMLGLLDFQDGQLTSIGELSWVDIDNGFIGEFENDLASVEANAPALWAELVTMRFELGVPQTVEDQIVLWSKFQQLVGALARNPWGDGMHLPHQQAELVRIARDILQYVDDLVAALVAHEQRQRPLSTMRIPGFNGVLGEENPPLIVSKFAADADLVERPLVASAEFSPADYVGPAVRGEVLDGAERAPLLAQLLTDNAARRRLPPRIAERTIAALATATDDELEWTLRETLGLGIHRLDAWNTAFANQVLASVREQRPRGLHAGSYAWVTDLQIPTEPVPRHSRGFLHAPSMAHAATASVIRSAWHARGSADGRSPAAVDLRSNRYRNAMWLIEGVRAGQTLGGLLGYEFERLCHDLEIDEQIARIRRLVGDAHGRHDGIEDPVDGIELMELFADGGVETHLRAVEAEFDTDRAEKVRLLLEGLAWSFDSIDDALLAESTHHLLGGNFERATAAIEAGSGGATPPPTPIGMDTMRSSRTVNHKVLLLADATAAAPAAWSIGIRDQISPPFEAFAASMLPAPSEVALTVIDSGGNVASFTVADLGLSALDAVYLTSDDPTTVDAPLAEIVRLATGLDGTVDTALDPGGAGVTLEEFQVVATSLRRLLSEARIAGAEDLDPELVGTAEPESALTDAATVLGDLLDVADDGSDATTTLTTEQRRRLALAGIVGTDTEISRVAARRVETSTALGTASARAIVGAAFGRPFPVSSPIEVAAAGATFDMSLADDDIVATWLDDVALVRPDVDRLVTTMHLGALLGGTDVLTAGTSQHPRHPGDSWAAIGLPTEGTGGRNVVSALWPGSTDQPPTHVVALVVDQWSEQIPGDSTITGVAMHYDAPSQRPPQALVLGVPETDERWTIDAAITLLLDAMEWMQLRAVAPEDLGDHGHTIPTVFTDVALHVDEVPARVDDEESP